MRDRRDRGHDGHEAHHGHGRDRERCGGERDCCTDGEGRDRDDCCDGDGDQERGGPGSGPDTRFLQFEMSQVLFGEAESVAKDALRALLLDAAKTRMQERFGSQIVGLAELAVDELLADILESLNVETRVHHRQRQQDRLKERLFDILGDRGTCGEGKPGRETRTGKEGPDDEDGEGGGEAGNR